MIEPAAGYVVIEQYEPDHEGLYMPTTEGSLIGRVLKVGPAALHVSGERVELGFIQAGDLVIYRKYTDQDVRWQGKEYKIVAFDSIVGSVTEDTNEK